MGADTFKNWCPHHGQSNEVVFRAMREEALYQHGHGGYSGTLAEKHDFVEFKVPSGVDPELFMDAIENYTWNGIGDEWGGLSEEARSQVHKAVAVYDAKWGPAVLIRTDTRVYVLGWASC